MRLHAIWRKLRVNRYSAGNCSYSMAAIGIMGLVAYAVSQQRKEIAIRIALGAKHAQVLAAILRQFSWPLILGLLTGLAATAAVSQVLRKTLYGISNLDPASYIAAILVIVAVAGIAALLPARRVLRLNVSRTLHYQ